MATITKAAVSKKLAYVSSQLARVKPSKSRVLATRNNLVNTNVSSKAPALTRRNSPLVRNKPSRSRSLASVEALPVWRSDAGAAFNGAFLAVDRSGKIRGTVKVGAVVVPRGAVHLYYRTNGVLINKTLTDTNGAFTFSGLDRSDANYYAVAIDSPYNAQVFDMVVPL